MLNINEFDPSIWFVNNEKITKFMNYFDHTYMDWSKPKGPSYLVMDNFLGNLSLEMNDLKVARVEADTLSRKVCADFEQDHRCDVLMWLKG